MAGGHVERPFGPAGVEVAVIGQGTWKMGEPRQRAVEVACLRRGIALGMRHIDTAEMYGNGAAEEMVGEAIAGLPRSSLFLVSKVLPQNASHAGTLAACEASLRRLGTDYLDVYLLHWRGRHPLRETVRAFEELADAGKIRAFGVSNFDAAELREAMSLARHHPLACNQVLYHLEERGPEDELLALCERERIALVGYSPFGARGFVAEGSPGGRALAAVAAELGPAVTPRQVALAFLVRRPPLFAIPKASTLAHVEENAAASALTLTDDQVRLIDAALP